MQKLKHKLALKKQVKISKFLRSQLLLICLTFFGFSSYAQSDYLPLEWTSTFETGGVGPDASALAETSDGFLIGASAYRGTFKDKADAGNGDEDFWVIKTDKYGNKVWENSIGGSGKDILKKIIANADGTFLLAGTSNSSVSGDKAQPSRGGNDFWLVKISKTGAVIWSKTIGGSSNDELEDMIITSDGNYLLVGTSISGVSGERSQSNRAVSRDGALANTPDYWIVKVNSAGNKIWDKAFGGGGNGSDYLKSAVTTLDGGFLLYGHTSSGIGYEKSVINFTEPGGGTTSDIWLIKTDAAGAKQWDNVYGGTLEERAGDIIQSPSGGFVMTGFSNSRISGNKTVEGYYDDEREEMEPHRWTFSISSDGLLSWQKALQGFLSFGGFVADTDGFYFLYEDEYRGFYTTGLEKYSWDGTLIKGKNIDLGFSTGSEVIKKGSDGNIFIVSNGTPGAAMPGFRSGLALSKYNTSLEVVPALSLTFRPQMVDEGTLFTIYRGSDYVNAVVRNFPYSKVELYDNGIKIDERNARIEASLVMGPPTTPGVHHLSAKATDAAGNVITSVTSPLTVFKDPAVLYKAINLNGSSVTVDRIPYQSTTGLADFAFQAKGYTNQSISLSPATDAHHANLIRSSLYGTATTPATFTLNNVPNGKFQVYLYTWEDNKSTTFSISLEGQTVLSQYESGAKGNWKKLGPFVATIKDGNIEIKTSGGDANISAIEVWKIEGQFEKAFNLNGPSLNIDGVTFQDGRSNSAINVSGKIYENQIIPLIPATDPNRAKMIRSSIYSTKTISAGIHFNNLSDYDLYDIYVYVWEDNNPTTYTLEGGETVIEKYYSGTKGTWSKVGPFRVLGEYAGLLASGGDGNLSGVELYRVEVLIPSANYSTSSTTVASRLGFEEEKNKMQNNGVTVSPIPMKNYLTIQLPEAENGVISLTILDPQGNIRQHVKKDLKYEQSLDLNTSELKAGVYFLKLKSSRFEKVIRIIKE